MDKLSLSNELRQLDTKNRDFYDQLDDTEKKKFSTYLMMKYSANVEGPADLQEWYLRVSNERVNQNFFDIGRHPKLQWLLCSSVSPNMGVHRHYWLSTKKSENKIRKFLEKHFPTLKSDEIDLIEQVNTKDDLKAYARQLGMSDQEIKKELG